MDILNILSAIKKITIKKELFTFENYYRRIGSPKEKCYYSMKHQKKKYLL